MSKQHLTRRQKLAQRPKMREAVDPKPVEQALFSVQEPSIQEIISQHVNVALIRAHAENNNLGSPEEEDDFELDDEDEMQGPGGHILSMHQGVEFQEMLPEQPEDHESLNPPEQPIEAEEEETQPE